MASRPVWKGQLRLSLVSIAVEIHAATRTGARISFRQIHGPSGKPVRYEKTVTGIGKIDTDDIMKGFELDNGDYLLLDKDEIEDIRLETKRTFELVQFVQSNEISPLYYDKPYYIVPTDELAQDAYRVVRDALRSSDRVGLGQLTMRGKEYLCAIRPCGDGLLMETLFYADEIKSADPLFAGIEDEAVDEDLLAVAMQLIDRKTAPFDAGSFKDHYDIALRGLVEAKRKNRKTPRSKGDGDDAGSADSTNVVDLMAALKDSVKASGTRKPAAPKASTRKTTARKKA
ncbi:DNA end-binding protein Ku [Loktanella fryxellensis]|uniref:Non-homologous end joining protein Ku n=1 Tax=Loktanella fryxellensis TaxID=245187 RepID=A0A1H8K0S4_9RHOB|nr:Ku protein [Loktanella fryxellensis]SEN86385.1 DNA end-binding protein Ku [Loktanella fryxellensis]